MGLNLQFAANLFCARRSSVGFIPRTRTMGGSSCGNRRQSWRHKRHGPSRPGPARNATRKMVCLFGLKRTTRTGERNGQTVFCERKPVFAKTTNTTNPIQSSNFQWSVFRVEMGRQTNRQAGERVDWRMSERATERASERTNARTSEGMNERTDEVTNERSSSEERIREPRLRVIWFWAGVFRPPLPLVSFWP